MEDEQVSECVWISKKLYDAQTKQEDPLTKWNVWKWMIRLYVQFNTR